MIFVGIDPGVHGAIAALDEEGRPLVVEFFPTLETPKAVKYRKQRDESGALVSKAIHGVKTEFDFSAVASLFDRVAMLPGQKLAYIESIAAMPRDAKTAAFTFGGSFWALKMALADRGIPYEAVRSKDWQAELLRGVPHSKENLRDAYLAKARTMFPEINLKLKKHAEQAAALLIAEYGRRQFSGHRAVGVRNVV